MRLPARTVRYRTGPYVGGGWSDGASRFEVEDLAEGGVFAEVAAGDADLADDALAAAEAAQQAMADATIHRRARWLEAIAAGVEERADELVDAVVREAGKPVTGARSEVRSAAERLRRAAGEARSLRGEFRPGSTPGHDGWRAIVRPEPVGTVLSIAPYNYPLATPVLHVAPAIAAGNAVIVKPASRTPVSTAILTEIVADVGLPEGAFNYVPGPGSVVGDALAGDDRVDAIALTGSSEAGERVARESGMVHLHMELGGNAPAVVFPDADLAAAAAACAGGGLKYAGQRCSAVSRVLVHEDVHDDLVRLLASEFETFRTGDLFDEATDLGPLIDEDQAKWVAGLVDDAVERGATLESGGDRDGRFVEPTLLADVPADARVVREEQFGPVVPVVPVEDEAEAIEVANASELALDAAVFTSDYDRAMRLAERIDAGAVRINGAPSHGIGDVPYGGNGASGIGRDGIGVTIETFTRTKSVVL